MSTVHRQPGGGDAIIDLLQAAWRYKGLIAAAVLLGGAAWLWLGGSPADAL